MAGVGDLLGIGQGISDIYGGFAAASADYSHANFEDSSGQLAEEDAKVTEARQRQLSYKMLSSMRAGYGASGVTLEGSPMDVLENSAANAELDALLIRHRGQVEKISHQYQASSDRYAGHASATAGLIKGGLSIGSTILGL